MSRLPRLLIVGQRAGKRSIIVGATLAALATAGVAAAGAGHAPWSDAPRPHLEAAEPTSSTTPAGARVDTAPATTSPVVTEPVVTEPFAAAVPTAPDAETPAAGGLSAGEPTPPPTTAADAGQGADPAATVEPDPVPNVVTTDAPATTEPAPAEPSTTMAAPPTTVRVDTPVPEGIVLTCSAAGSTVTCNWSGGVVPSFAKFLVLRGDGGPRGRVPFQSNDPGTTSFIDNGVPVGSYSYVVVSVDGNNKNLVHSNPQFIQIPANN